MSPVEGHLYFWLVSPKRGNFCGLFSPISRLRRRSWKSICPPVARFRRFSRFARGFMALVYFDLWRSLPRERGLRTAPSGDCLRRLRAGGAGVSVGRVVPAYDPALPVRSRSLAPPVLEQFGHRPSPRFSGSPWISSRVGQR